MGHDEPMTFTDWHPGQPDNLKQNQHCVNIQFWQGNGGYHWDDEDCNEKFYFLCEQRTSK